MGVGRHRRPRRLRTCTGRTSPDRARRRRARRAAARRTVRSRDRIRSVRLARLCAAGTRAIRFRGVGPGRALCGPSHGHGTDGVARLSGFGSLCGLAVRHRLASRARSGRRVPNRYCPPFARPADTSRRGCTILAVAVAVAVAVCPGAGRAGRTGRAGRPAPAVPTGPWTRWTWRAARATRATRPARAARPGPRQLGGPRHLLRRHARPAGAPARGRG